jgi:hypothetical protein
MTALQAGCQQKPANGSLLGLSGTIFTTMAVNITAPARNITAEPSGAGSSSMTPGTIVGIAAGIGLLLFSGIALFFIYWRRQKKQRYQDNGYKLDSHSTTPDPHFPPENTGMSQSLRSFAEGGSVGGGVPGTMSETAPPYMSSGEYYDKMEKEARTRTVNYAFDPRNARRGPNSALPTHQAYRPMVARSESPANAGQRKPSPPVLQHRYTRSHTPDSYALRTYLTSSEDASEPRIRAPPPARQASSRVDHRRASSVPLPPPPPRAAKIPAISLPSVPRIRVPKKYTPPTLQPRESTPQTATEAAAGPSASVATGPMHISGPVMVSSGSRFQDKPLQGEVVYATRRPESQLDIRKGDYKEVAIHSGKSMLYGM